MEPKKITNRLAFKILPSPETNDHEVRILIDDIDVLGNDYLGIDPVFFFDQDSLCHSGELLIRRCTCGSPGCSDVPITVACNETSITWKNKAGMDFLFEKTEYLRSIQNAKEDHAWENMERRVERIAEAVLKNSTLMNGYYFDWASARIKDKKIALSYSSNGLQKLFEIAWDGQTENNVEQNAIQFLKEKGDWQDA